MGKTNENRPCINITIYPIKYDRENPLSIEYDPREILGRFIEAYDPENPNAFCYIFDEQDKSLKSEEYGLVFINANCSLIRIQG